MPNLDDWFEDSHLSVPRGWEVELGSAFDDERFDDYLTVFVRAHDDRMGNDRDAFRLLLTGYVGANEDGTLSGESPGPRYCLRETMLGYLKTYEVTTGNCGSCSVCVPDGRFETCPKKRADAVVRLGKNVEEKLRAIEQCDISSPQPALVAGFWHAVETEEGLLHHSIAAHLFGWSMKLITETNGGHRGALWTQLLGMRRDTFDLRPEGFADYVLRLIGDPTGDEHEFLWETLLEAPIALEAIPSFHEAKAQLARKLHRPKFEAASWQTFIVLETANERPNEEKVRSAHLQLCTLFDPTEPGSLPDPMLHEKHALAAGVRAGNVGGR